MKARLKKEVERKGRRLWLTLAGHGEQNDAARLLDVGFNHALNKPDIARVTISRGSNKTWRATSIGFGYIITRP